MRSARQAILLQLQLTKIGDNKYLKGIRIIFQFWINH